MKIIYECEICGEQYNTEQDALDCEATVTRPPVFTVGETVYIPHRYPRYADKPLGKRTIIKHEIIGHCNEYTLDKRIKITKDFDIWKPTRYDYDRYRGMFDIDLGNCVFRLGDLLNESIFRPIDLWNVPVTEELVDDE